MTGVRMRVIMSDRGDGMWGSAGLDGEHLAAQWQQSGALCGGETQRAVQYLYPSITSSDAWMGDG